MKQKIEADVDFFLALKKAAETHNTDKLTAFAQTTAALASYASQTNMPSEVCLMLENMLAEFRNLTLGHQTLLVAPKKGGRPAKPTQHEAAWAWASVYLDLMGGTPEAIETVESRFATAGLPLPGKKGGASLRQWRHNANSERNNDHIELHFIAAREVVETLKNEGMPASKAAAAMLNAVVARG